MGETWVVQLAPPFVVARMVPPSPTIQPVLASAKVTSSRYWGAAGSACDVQVAPPFTVFSMVPAAPTAQPVLVSANQVDERSLPWGDGFCQYQEPPGAATFAAAGSAHTAAATRQASAKTMRTWRRPPDEWRMGPSLTTEAMMSGRPGRYRRAKGGA